MRRTTARVKKIEKSFGRSSSVSSVAMGRNDNCEKSVFLSVTVFLDQVQLVWLLRVFSVHA
jgi:hypothetical protein